MTPSDGEEEPQRAPERVAAAVRELAAAFVFLTGLPGADVEPELLARGAMFFPLLGLLLGALGAALAAAVRAVAGPPAAPAVALLYLAALGRAAQPLAVARGIGDGFGVGALGWLALAALLAAKLLALTALGGGPLLGISLMLGAMLGRWALVVQTYGSIPAAADGFASAMTRGLKFREFGVASVSAMALTLMLANAVGLVLLLATATLTIALRIAAHRSRGGVSRTSILAGGELAETAVLLACAALARLIAGG